MSCTINTGRMMAAAWIGDMTSASTGWPSTDRPVKPPLESPTRMVAGTAAA